MFLLSPWTNKVAPPPTIPVVQRLGGVKVWGKFAQATAYVTGNGITNIVQTNPISFVNGVNNDQTMTGLEIEYTLFTVGT